MTVSEFCAQHALTYQIYLWRKKLSDDSQQFAQQDNWLAFDMPASGNQSDPGRLNWYYPVVWCCG
ncbi:hypothetical protein [Alteromonas mediterranea]|uniref:hypothetical protein n=1 Tax=Alteromonas mediterranea TaxID=314275 RepID=UPI004046D4F3